MRRSSGPEKPAAARSRAPAQGFPKLFVYPFFGVHMLMFGLSGFGMAYGSNRPDLVFLYLHGGLAICVYLVFYHVIFGRDQVRWMLINAALGILGIYAQVGWILERFGRRIGDYPWQVHVVPFLYYVLYTFLLRQLLIDVTGSRDRPARRAAVDAVYVALSLLVYGLLLVQTRGGA
ncbi:hypothetical protein [Luteimonas kalidii]|uniref:Uncharacterized protein n=1 Tax=Luteimonas kalidii TaxID=3042025 RepID=A0ABT6JPM8_9GAMM|nr:hypothetical protein [Luteimonas kalidii]MDH5832592.1 hypothetical protein [Luteimonas kalidii]